VTYPNGTPIKRGRITVTINRTKKERGVVVGTGEVSEGKFRVECHVPSTIPAGSYAVVAHYRGPDAYPGNSDPELVIRRRPSIDLNTTSTVNGTLIRGFVHYADTPINGTLLVRVKTRAGIREFSLKLNNGTFLLKLGTYPSSLEVYYPGNEVYLPVRKDVELASGRFGIFRLKINPVGILYVLLPALIVGASLVVIRRKPSEPQESGDIAERKVENRSFNLRRRVFLETEEIPLEIPEGCRVNLDGAPIKSGKLGGLPPGRHLLSACGKTLELWVLPLGEAMIKLYELHFLPFARSITVTSNRTPYEIALSLIHSGVSKEALTIAKLFNIARYSLRLVNERDFFTMLEAMEGVGVFE
jgi:hypothetical protein